MERVGWIGTGVMGKSMCARIMKNGHHVSVYNKTKNRTENLCRDGAVWLDNPGEVAAESDMVFTMVGGDEAVSNLVLPLSQLMGRNIALMGGAGMGQHTKMSNQILVASTMIGVVESILYARRAGLDMNQVIDLVGKGVAASWAYNQIGPMILRDDFAPGFYIRHFVKDMGIALMEAKRMKLAFPGLALANQFYMAAVAEGLETNGTQAL